MAKSNVFNLSEWGGLAARTEATECKKKKRALRHNGAFGATIDARVEAQEKLTSLREKQREAIRRRKLIN